MADAFIQEVGHTISGMTFGLIKLLKMPFRKRNKIAAEQKAIAKKERENYYEEELRKYKFAQKTKKENELKKERNNLRIKKILLKNIKIKIKELKKSSKIYTKQLKNKNLTKTKRENREILIWNNNFNSLRLLEDKVKVEEEIHDKKLEIFIMNKKVQEDKNITFTGQEPIWNIKRGKNEEVLLRLFEKENKLSTVN